MNEKFIEIGLKLLEEPVKLLIAISVYFAYKATKKNEKLTDEISSVNASYIKDIKEFSNEFKNDISALERTISDHRVSIDASIDSLREEFGRLHDELDRVHQRIVNDFSVDLSKIKKVDQIHEEMKEGFGRIFFVEEKLKTRENDIIKTRENLKDVAKILIKHKEQIKKLSEN